VAKINPSGSALVYSTYLGGNSSDDGSGIAVDGAGNAYVVGSTGSFDFPTKNPFQSTCGFDGDAFVTKINSAGSALVYSTCLGGHNTDFGQGIAVDRSGNAYVVGSTNAKDFPTASPAQPLKKLYFDAFVTKFNTNGSALFCSTFLGGDGLDYGYGIAVDASGNAYVTGVTPSTNFPTKNPLQPVNRGGGDAFVAKIQMVAKTTTMLSSSPNPSNYAQAVTFTAVVTSSPGLGAPLDGETVTFMKGTRAMGTGVFSGGSANFTTSALSPGPHAITAIYGGDSNFAGSKSNTVKQVVN
jgi:hypothetical protein